MNVYCVLWKLNNMCCGIEIVVQRGHTIIQTYVGESSRRGGEVRGLGCRECIIKR